MPDRDPVEVEADALARYLYDNEWRLSQVQGFGYGTDGMLKTVRDCWLDHDRQTIWQKLATPEVEGDVQAEMMFVIRAYQMSVALRETGVLSTAQARGAEGMREAAAVAVESLISEWREQSDLPPDAIERSAPLVGEFFNSVAQVVRELPVSDAPASPWQSMDSAPKDGTRVDLWVRFTETPEEERRIADASWEGEHGEWRLGRGDFAFRQGQYAYPVIVLAWMPIPTPPAKDETV